MSLSTPTIDRLCHDQATRTEAYRILLVARHLTGPGTGFDLGGVSSGLDAICAYLASLNLNNTSVTFQAAQAASCQSLAKFKHLRDKVAGALKAHRDVRCTQRASQELLCIPHLPSPPSTGKVQPPLRQLPSRDPPPQSQFPSPRPHPKKNTTISGNPRHYMKSLTPTPHHRIPGL
ncbi:hypothetical protein C8R43DRAFT_1120325 [Mycena crocata]|nr:hypothetical protein C8R43DRAFT_1120325 [Mycena crocata]